MRRTLVHLNCYIAMKTIVVAGGTGLIGKRLVTLWREHGHEVRILSRGKTRTAEGVFHWNPVKQVIDMRVIEGAQVLVNLTGAGIADKRWTDGRVRELYTSRVDTTLFLLEQFEKVPTLEHYISASGAVCYGFEQPEKEHAESDPFGKDVLSDVTMKWEAAARRFEPVCAVTCIRIPVVLAPDGGALPTMLGPVKWGIGSPLGNGRQGIPWVHVDDLTQLFDYCLHHQLAGIFNANAGNTTNKELLRTAAKVLKRPFFFPNVPGFALKMILGKMATVVLDGLKTSNQLIRSKGFAFEFTELDAALRNLLKK